MRRLMRQSGFAYIAAVVLLIVVAGVCAALLRLSGTQQDTINLGLMGARANLAARGGVEWGFYRLRGGSCEASRLLGDFAASSGFSVTVRCTAQPFNEGERQNAAGAVEAVAKTIFTIDAVACNGAAACPATDAATVSRPDYVERRRVATVCMVNGFPAEDC